MYRFVTLALALSGVQALNLPRQTNSSSSPEQQNAALLQQTCAPRTSDNRPDFTAPCNAIQVILWQCLYGSNNFPQWNVSVSDPMAAMNSSMAKRSVCTQTNQGAGGDSQGGSSECYSETDLMEQDAAAQRTCICESQFFDQAAGCADCYNAHGFDFVTSGTQLNKYGGLRSGYCAASSTPTQGFPDYVNSMLPQATVISNSSAPAGSNYSVLYSPSTLISDPLQSKTAVSLYFTPSVTGTAAYYVAQSFTQTGSVTGVVTYASTNVVSGQIVPTAAAAQKSSVSGSGYAAGSAGASGTSTGSASGASSSAISSSGATENTAVKAGAVIIGGLAAVVALL